MAQRDHARMRTPVVVAVRLLIAALLGALAGLVVGVLTPAHVEVVGSDARVWLEPGRDYDQFGVDRVLTLTRATSRSLLGEPVGVRASLDLDASALTDPSGEFNTDVLPAYIQAYSDPAQLADSIRWAVVKHLLVCTVVGAIGFALAWAAWHAYRRWRVAYDRSRFPDRHTRVLAHAYRAPERTAARRGAVAAIVLVLLFAIPSARSDDPQPTRITGDALFDGTPLAGIQLSGLLRPAIAAARNYIDTYFDQTNVYYDRLQRGLEAYLAANPVELPGSGSDTDAVEHVGFVTDRHCNIGMDRVVVALLDHFDVQTLVSGGDDAFSGSFGFEAACTRNLADKTKQAGITDVFVAGNHDSPATMADERDQGIKTLDSDVVSAHGLRFIGAPDPRTSRYGQGIVPAAHDAQVRLLEQQATAVGTAACVAPAPLIAVLHDPLAGNLALQHGCGHITLALDGHTHHQGGPRIVPLPDGRTGYQFTGASSGGAPGEGAIERSFASQLTVGPLNHDATVNIVSVNRDTGELIGVTVFRFSPDQTITVTRLPRP